MLLRCSFYFPPLFCLIAFTLHSILQYWCFICLLFLALIIFFVSCPWVYRINNDFEFIVSCEMCRELRLMYTAGNYEWKWKTYYLLHSAYLNRLNNEEVNDIKYSSCFTQHLLLLSSSKQITVNQSGRIVPPLHVEVPLRPLTFQTKFPRALLRSSTFMPQVVGAVFWCNSENCVNKLRNSLGIGAKTM